MAASSFDVIVVGGGPAGSVCAAVCASAGLRVALLERARFPREKVCGDCLNPRSWEVLGRLGFNDAVRQLPHSILHRVHFFASDGRELVVPLPSHSRGEIGVKRSDLDALLFSRAQSAGAITFQATSVTRIERGQDHRWRVSANAPGSDSAAPLLIRSDILVAADGRNSTVARALKLLPAAARDRVGLQTHLPLPPEAGGSVAMRFLKDGYCGLADVGGGQANLCLVSAPEHIAQVKAWATAHYRLSEQQAWRSITPLERAAIHPVAPGLLLIGDAARVVEPFTGEGIYYALATGELAGRCIAEKNTATYHQQQRALYRGRLWVNGLARVACKHPTFASGFLTLARWWPALLRFLTRKVVA